MSPGNPGNIIDMAELLKLMVDQGASDLHITLGAPPMLRVDGLIIPTAYPKLSAEVCQRLIYSLLTDTQKQRFESMNELDLSFGIKDIGRVRMNVYKQRGAIAAALRSIPQHIQGLDELGLPPMAYDVLKTPKGLILVTGPTGSGKSTTLASMIDYINSNQQVHILTVEDPIEFVHYHKKAIVNQREIGSDTSSFPQALKYVVRQDPDIILISKLSGRGRVLAAEVLVVTPAVRNLIRDEKTEQILISMQTGAKFGMQTMNMALHDLYARHLISFQEAMAASTDPDDLKRIMQRGTPMERV
jgi:twitching motility protein PilT